MKDNALCISIEEMGHRLGISRTLAYQMARSEGFPAVRLGRRLVVPVAALERWLDTHSGSDVALTE